MCRRCLSQPSRRTSPSERASKTCVAQWFPSVLLRQTEWVACFETTFRMPCVMWFVFSPVAQRTCCFNMSRKQTVTVSVFFCYVVSCLPLRLASQVVVSICVKGSCVSRAPSSSPCFEVNNVACQDCNGLVCACRWDGNGGERCAHLLRPEHGYTPLLQGCRLHLVRQRLLRGQILCLWLGSLLSQGTPTCALTPHGGWYRLPNFPGAAFLFPRRADHVPEGLRQ